MVERPPWALLANRAHDVRPVIDIYATPQGRDLGGVAADIRKVMQETAHDVPNGAIVFLRGQVTTMTSAYQQLFVGLGFALVLIYLLIVVNFQSWLDPLVIVMALPTALAGIVWMLFANGTTPSVPALIGALMCMGVANSIRNARATSNSSSLGSLMIPSIMLLSRMKAASEFDSIGAAFVEGLGHFAILSVWFASIRAPTGRISWFKYSPHMEFLSARRAIRI